MFHLPRRRMTHFQWLMVVLALLAAIIALGALTSPRAYGAEKPVPAPGSGKLVPKKDAKGNISAFSVPDNIGPAYDRKWRSKSLSNMCLENHSSFPMQIHTGEWDKANDLNLNYEGCGPATADPDAAYPYWARIDVYDGYNTSQNCSYAYIVRDTQGYTYRYIIYLNKAIPSCWSGTVRKNHYTSEAIGIALGLKWFDTYPPTHVSVMRAQSYDTVSYAQPGDRATFDYWNDCGCHV